MGKREKTGKKIGTREREIGKERERACYREGARSRWEERAGERKRGKREVRNRTKEREREGRERTKEKKKKKRRERGGEIVEESIISMCISRGHNHTKCERLGCGWNSISTANDF